ncbi:MAG: hypothetical protein DBX55_02740 [Verrucomicrobia bacterium]|nr:MAG: hypothetical protein DBX55_02740 [Verrucomicrobiota bacterium]
MPRPRRRRSGKIRFCKCARTRAFRHISVPKTDPQRQAAESPENVCRHAGGETFRNRKRQLKKCAILTQTHNKGNRSIARRNKTTGKNPPNRQPAPLAHFMGKPDFGKMK